MKLPGAEKAEVTEARMIQELEDVILTCDLPAQGLRGGILAQLCWFMKAARDTKSSLPLSMEKRSPSSL